MTRSPRRTILIAGPTASGKSALAICLARRFGGVVINADSMQVYSDLQILTARPTAAEEASVPHRLYGFIGGEDAYSAGRYAIDARAAIEDARQAGCVPIVVGGSGLYLRALVEGLAPIPVIAPEIREKWRRLALTADGDVVLHRELLRLDPVMAGRLAPGDRQRMARALEVLEATGRSLADWQCMAPTPVLEMSDTVRLWLDIERADLHRRCDGRLEDMVRAGVIDEVARLLALGLAPDLPVMRAVGVGELARHVRGETGLEEALEHAKAATRQYVKRQLTWARRNMITWNKLDTKYIKSILDGNERIIE